MEHAQQSSDQSKRAAFPRAEDAIVADLHKALRQDMLQEAADEFLGTRSAEACFPAAGILVGKGDIAVSKSADAPVAQCHAKDVGSQILECRHTAAHRLAVDHPVPGPDLRRHLLEQVRSPEGIPELRPVDDGQRFHRQEEALPAMVPAFPVLDQPAARNQVVHMRVVVQIACPGVQHTDHADPPTHEAGILG